MDLLKEKRKAVALLSSKQSPKLRLWSHKPHLCLISQTPRIPSSCSTCPLLVITSKALLHPLPPSLHLVSGSVLRCLSSGGPSAPIHWVSCLV